MTPLCELAQKYSTDKGGGLYDVHQKLQVYNGVLATACHNNTPYYHELYGTRRNEVRAVLEIGILCGSSLRMWADYFPNAQIVGIDIDPKTMFSAPRITTFVGDQRNLGPVLQSIPISSFDLILDDGLHDLENQSLALQTLLPYLVGGGFYIVEDLGTESVPNWLIEQVQKPGYTCWDKPITGGFGNIPPVEHLLIVRKDL